MNVFLHFVTGSFLPDHGGLEQSLFRLASSLVAVEGIRARIYSRSTNIRGREGLVSCPEHLSIIYLYNESQSLLAPLEETPTSVLNERSRIEVQLLHSRVQAAMVEYPHARHVIVSYYISSSGFIAQQVASRLRIPHIASVRGTDFNSDFYNPSRNAAIEFVVRHASFIVTTNRQQEAALRELLQRNKNIKTIYNGSAITSPRIERSRPPSGPVRLFSDTGLSYKKGSHVLLRAFASLVRDGVDCTLRLCGTSDVTPFWSRLLDDVAGICGDRLIVEGYLSKAEIRSRLADSDIYCSATLGEGCSNSRVEALTSGLPIVSTATGELVDFEVPVPTVRLAVPGDQESFARCLRDSIQHAIASRSRDEVPVSLEKVTLACSPEAERREWLDTINAVLPKADTITTHKQRRVLFFVHDGTGLGHLQRLSRLAEAIQGPCAALIVSGHRQAAWVVPPECEYVHLPSLDSLVPESARYWGRQSFLDAPLPEAIAFRQKILDATIAAFDPDLIVVDYLPLGKNAELQNALLRSRARKYFIMRGVMDHSANLRRDALQGKGEEFLRRHYDRVLVTCDQRICDVVDEYDLDDDVARKTTYLGYVGKRYDASQRLAIRSERGIGDGETWVVCSAGGGKLGEKLIELCTGLSARYPHYYFDIIIGPRSSTPWPYRSIDVYTSGKTRFWRECQRLALLHASADVVVCPGGYNSLVETLQGHARVICAPVQVRTNGEQYIHGRRLSQYADVTMLNNIHELETVFATIVADAPSARPIAEPTPLNLDGASAFRRVVLRDLGIE